MENLIDAKELLVKYKSKIALNGINLELPKGKIIGLLGPNGSGKTTFIKTVAGLLTPASGELLIDGQKIGVESKKIVSYLPDTTYLNQSMKIEGALELFEDFYEDFSRETAEKMLEELGLSKSDKFRSLSKGNKEKVQLILVMSRKASLYILDEPIGGVDPAARDYILNVILKNYNPESSIIISTHLIGDVENIFEEIIFIKNGNIVLTGNADEIRAEKDKSIDQLFREVFAC